MDPKYIALSVFVIVYILFVFFPNIRALFAILGAMMLIITQILTVPQAFLLVNWNVMGIFVGMLIVADVFMESRVPAHIAEVLVDKAPNTKWAILFICLMASFISAFVENVATVLIVAPIALSLSQKLKFNPMNMMIAIAIASNLEGTATLIGDPPSMLLGSFAKMNFNDFFFYKGKPGIFFAVQIGALFSFMVLMYIFRKHKEKVALVSVEEIKSWVPTIILVGLIMVLAILPFYDKGFAYSTGIASMAAGFIALVWEIAKNKSSIIKNIKKLDWETTILLMGIFIVVGGLSVTGWTEIFSTFLSGLVGTNIFMGYTLIVFISVLLSGFIDNVPYLIAMMPVAVSMSDKLHINPSLFLFGLLIGCCLGGNITPIGASANVVACSILKKEGYPVTFGKFMKIGIPFTLVAVVASYLFIWVIWH